MRLHTARTVLVSLAIISLTTACKNNEPPSPEEQKEPATKFIMQGHFDQPEVCVNIGPAIEIVGGLVIILNYCTFAQLQYSSKARLLPLVLLIIIFHRVPIVAGAVSGPEKAIWISAAAPLSSRCPPPPLMTL